MLAAMRRPLLALLIVLTAIGVFAGGLAWLLDTPRASPGASRAERRHGLVANENHMRRGSGGDRPAHLVGRGTENRAPDAGGERGQERGEQEDGERTGNRGPSTG